MLNPHKSVPKPVKVYIEELGRVVDFKNLRQEIQDKYLYDWKWMDSTIKEELKKDAYDTTRDRRIKISNLVDPTDSDTTASPINNNNNSKPVVNKNKY